MKELEEMIEAYIKNKDIRSLVHMPEKEQNLICVYFAYGDEYEICQTLRIYSHGKKSEFDFFVSNQVGKTEISLLNQKKENVLPFIDIIINHLNHAYHT